jgi:5-formaminoimidazole-4-carboxamide-1-(beta)-D-ribofuranosyl 5'-monophosphate synthetase
MVMERRQIQELASSYEAGSVTVGVLGSHSAEEVGVSARSFGLPTVVVCQEGREALYAKHNKHLYDHVIVLNRFSDIASEEVQDQLRELNTIFIPNRSFSVYVGYDAIEDDFRVPLYGNRGILRAEERTEERSQYWLLEEAGIRFPRKFDGPDKIDRLAIVKVQQKKKPLERAFFFPASPEEYEAKSKDLLERDIIDEVGLEKARIEEYILGQKFNANFQGWALQDVFGDFDLVGFDDRKQTNLHGVLGLPARNQLMLDVPIKNEEIGHYGLTMRESQKPLVYDAAEKFRRITEREYPPGMLGLFALQGAVSYDSDDPDRKRLAFYVFDVSPRIPGCPCVGPTSPEMRRLSLKHRRYLDEASCPGIAAPMDLPMLEIRVAVARGELGSIVT